LSQYIRAISQQPTFALIYWVRSDVHWAVLASGVDVTALAALHWNALIY